MIQQNILVAINCMTYNHEPYIRQCLDGFVKQKTNFSFVAIVHDDASTDGTAAIIKEYAEKFPYIIKPIYEIENQYSKRDDTLCKIMMNAIEETGCKYLAFCEGDDYWIDPYKLQKQIKILENNDDIGLVYSKAKYFIQSKKKFKGELGRNFLDFKTLLKQNCIPTLTVTLRTNLYKNYIREIQPNTRNWKMGDFPTWLWFAKNSKISFIDEPLGVYRILQNSASHLPNKLDQLSFTVNFHEIAYYFASKYHEDENYALSQLLWAKFIYAANKGDKSIIADTAYKSIVLYKKNKCIKLVIIILFAKYPKTFSRLLDAYRTLKSPFEQY